MQEKIRRGTRDGSSSKHDDEENLALVSKVGKGKGRLPIPNWVLPMVGRRLTNLKCDALIVMRWAIMLQTVHKINPRRDRRKDQMVRHWPHSSNWISPSSHAWFHRWWVVFGTWTVEPHSTWSATRAYSVPWRRRTSRCACTQNNTLGKASAKNLNLCIIIQVEISLNYKKL